MIRSIIALNDCGRRRGCPRYAAQIKHLHPIHATPKSQQDFRPRSVALVGTSGKENSVGRVVLENLKAAEFPGPIYPINPKYESLLGLACYPSLAQLPATPDLAIIATPAASVPQVVRECGQRDVNGMIILSAGFREIGPSGQAVEAKLRDAIGTFPKLSVIGPNCLGLMSPVSKLNASFAAAMPKSGRIALISQSGAMHVAARLVAASKRRLFALCVDRQRP